MTASLFLSLFRFLTLAVLSAAFLSVISCQTVKKPEPDHAVVTDDAAAAIARFVLEKSSGGSFASVAVMRFTAEDGRELRYANLLTERLIYRLRDNGRLKVVRKPDNTLDSVLSGSGGSVSPERARDIAREWGAEAVIAGRVREGRYSNRITAVLLDARTGQVLGELAVVESLENYRLGSDSGP